jgi:hypothetical protein
LLLDVCEEFCHLFAQSFIQLGACILLAHVKFVPEFLRFGQEEFVLLVLLLVCEGKNQFVAAHVRCLVPETFSQSLLTKNFLLRSGQFWRFSSCLPLFLLV